MAKNNNRRTSTSLEGKANTTITTASVINIHDMATDYVNAALKVDTALINHAEHMRTLVAELDSKLITGTCTLREPDEKSGKQAVVGTCRLTDLLTDIRAQLMEHVNNDSTIPDKEKYTAYSRLAKVTRENILKSQCRSAVKFVIDRADEKASVTMLVNDAGNARYLTLSMGTKTDGTCGVSLNRGDAEAGAEAGKAKSEFDLDAFAAKCLKECADNNVGPTKFMNALKRVLEAEKQTNKKQVDTKAA